MSQVLKDYKEAMSILENKFADTVFLERTFPLSHVKLSLKTKIKQMFGFDEIWEFGANIYLNRYNSEVRALFQTQNSFFDFSKILTIKPDGTISTFVHNKVKYSHMYADYTYDGTHLNEMGKQKAAEQFLKFC